MRRSVTFFVITFCLLTTASAFADQFGPTRSQAKPGHPYLGVGYTFASGNFENSAVPEDLIDFKQNRLFVQAGLALWHGWDLYVRGGMADLEVHDAFRLPGEDFQDRLQPYATAGLNILLYDGDVLDVGVFAQGSYFSEYEEETTGTGTFKTILIPEPAHETIFIDKLWEIDGGLSFMTELEGAYLYGGPFYYQAEADYRSVAVGLTSGLVDREDIKMEEEGHVGVFAGILWPLKSGFNLLLEGMYKSDLSLGAGIHYPF